MRLAQHDIVGLIVGNDKTCVVQRLGEPAFTDHENRSRAFLRFQEAHRGHCGREDPPGFYLQADAGEAVREVLLRVLGIVGEHEELATALVQLSDECVRARNDPGSPHQNTIHVDKVVFLLPIHDGQIIAGVRAHDKARAC